jgi:hypothetical protein
MANPKISVFDMTLAGDTYTFSHQDGYYSEKIEGTTKEIAYLMFQAHINARHDGYGAIYEKVGPFMVEDGEGKANLKIGVDFLSSIRPEPNDVFWSELNGHFARFLNLIAFS